MKKWTFVLGSLILMLSFQNCAKTNLQTPQDTAATPARIDYAKTSASGYSVLQMWDYEGAKNAELDLNSGRMSVFTDFGGERADDRCLNDQERAQVQQLLQAAEVCAPNLEPDAFLGRQCTMLYKYPYAVLMNGGDQVRLGEMTNGCDVPTDLCGDSSQKLKDFVQQVMSSLDQHACQ